MAKDAKGHGSEKRGGPASYENVSTKPLVSNATRDRLVAARNDPNHPLGVLSRVVSQGTPIAGQDAAADELSRGTPPSKAGPAPVHSGASGPSMADFVKNMQAGQREDSNVVRNRAGKRAYGSRWRSKDGTF